MQPLLEDKMQMLSAVSGYDTKFLMDMWKRVRDEAAEDGVEPDWEQFCAIAVEHDF